MVLKTISQQGYIKNTWNKLGQRLKRYLFIPVHDQSNICFRKCIKCPPQGIYYVFCIKLREEEHNTNLSVGMCCKTCLIRNLWTTLLGSENYKIRTEYLCSQSAERSISKGVVTQSNRFHLLISRYNEQQSLTINMSSFV